MTAVEAGRKLRQKREARRLSVSQLANRAGVSHTTIRNYERGLRDDGSEFTPNQGTIMKVAASFPAEDRAEILEAFGLEDLARNAQEQSEAAKTTASQEGQQFIVVGVVADSTDTIIVRDEQGRHRIFREVHLRSSSKYNYGPDEAPF